MVALKNKGAPVGDGRRRGFVETLKFFCCRPCSRTHIESDTRHERIEAVHSRKSDFRMEDPKLASAVGQRSGDFL